MKAKKNQSKKRRAFLNSLLILAVIGVIIYKLADRYLIEHVEVKNAITNESSVSSTQSSKNSTKEHYKADYWSYSSNSKKITIKKVKIGSADRPTTYFVADVRIKNSDSLQSAFAKNQFGNNIVEYTSDIANESHAIFAINGDYYGFRDDGITIRNGKIFRNNPARTGLAIYKDGTMKTYKETETTAKKLVSDGVTQTFSFGPTLVKNSKAIQNFGKISVDTNFGNRPIDQVNPRTGIGIISANHFVFVVVDGRSQNYSNGLTLPEFAKVFEKLGCTDAYNLDGGGSSTMYFRGRVVNNPLGRHEERGVSDIIYIK